MNVKAKIEEEVQQILNRPLILNRRFLDDEQLIRAEQVAVLEEIFNANVRDREIREISAHFAPILRGDHPVHLALWGKTGTGKTLTTIYFLNLLAEMCCERNVPIRHVQLNLSTPQPCFRALNDLACLLNACKRYRKGISLEELMGRIEGALAGYHGYLILFIDEVDNVRRDHDTFLAFLIRRLPQRIPAKLILIFASNRLNWMEHLDPRVQSFLKVYELIFDPYDAVDLQRILNIRVEKALRSGAARPGVIEKIAALSSRDHGDARKAVALLASSASLAEKAGSAITLQTVDQASERIEQDKYTTMIRTAPRQLQAALAAAINAFRAKTGATASTGEVYEAYQRFCRRAGLRPLAGRAFGDLLAELDMYAFLHARVQSRGRYGRTREIQLDLPEQLISKIYDTILLSLDVAK
ncbi:MAG: AAA family ATPase [Phycisphaerae bacterium]|nr:AAA family ATPase [Phycisphaerae bacterium]